MEIFKLFGSILVDSSKAEDSISKTNDKAETLSGKLGKGIETAGKWGLAIAGGAAAAGAAIGAVVMKATDAAGALDDTSKRIGMTAEEYQKYAYAAKLSGLESDKLEGAMKKQQKVFDEAKTGSEKASEAYRQLGIDINSIGSSGEAFEAVVKKLADMSDVNERNALANQIFGKSYADLLPLMADGAAGIDQLKQQAVDMGAVMSNEAVAAGATFGDTLDSLKMSLSGAMNGIGVEFIPILQALAEWITEHMPQIKETVSVAFEVISTVIGTAYGWFKENLLPVLADLFSWIQENMPEIQAVVGAVFGAVMDIVGQVWGIFRNNLIPILKELWDFISPTFPLIEGIVKVTFGAVVKTVQIVIDIFDKATAAIKTAIDWLMFWNDEEVKEKKPKTSSAKRYSHASGLPYVPYDGYQAELHKGERVLTADQNNSMIENIINGMSTVLNSQPKGGPIVLQVGLDSKIIAQAIYDPLKDVAIQKGVPA